MRSGRVSGVSSPMLNFPTTRPCAIVSSCCYRRNLGVVVQDTVPTGGDASGEHVLVEILMVVSFGATLAKGPWHCSSEGKKMKKLAGQKTASGFSF